MSLPQDKFAVSDDPTQHIKTASHKVAGFNSKNHTTAAKAESNLTLGLGRATSERIPTSTWGSFTIVTVVLLLIVICLILNCNRIRRKVTENRIGRLKRSEQSLSFEKRHKELQEAEVEWNNNNNRLYDQHHNPHNIYPYHSSAYTTQITANAIDKWILTTPESAYSSKFSSITSTTLSSSASTVAHNPALLHNGNSNKGFGESPPPGVQLQMTLDNSSLSSSPTLLAEPPSVQKVACGV
ncbi:hypothetical protein BDF20DRAFT_832730 [Mycotypha africana]|uniref:uncharacterized protein n=1 Tax=Mycotypha africana TaxID=64632 RepID=UPI002300F298|nr:uncharacterized protein BDF20DRAFT_832730 [Mycotypha africana]KAI8987831.1 hypothetical protein BDF20DRAFT_832730 [Mycotypha africana]